MARKEGEEVKISESFGIASFILGLQSIILIMLQPFFGIICGILGLIFAIKQRRQARTGLAKAGLILSAVGLVLSIVMAIFTVIYALALAKQISAGIA